MRFTSLIIELIRARPRLVVWIVVLLQAALWLILPLLLYRSPPGDLATVLAFGREYQVGTDLGPPLAFWLADIAFRAAGNHMFGVYLLAQLCSIATFWALYLLARAIVGGQQAVLAVLLTMTVTAFSSPGVEFGPLVLARPLWALLLLHSWQLIGQDRRNAWFAWSIEAGLLLLTTSAAIGLLLLVAGFALATARGRRMLMSFDPLFALLVIVVLALPYLIWLIRADTLALPPLAGDRGFERDGRCIGLGCSAACCWRCPASCCWWCSTPAGSAASRKRRRSSIRPPVDPLARNFVYFFAHRAGARGKPDRRPVRSRPRRRRRRHRAVDVGTGRDRRDRRSGSSAAPARAALGLGGRHRRARARRDRGDAVSALDRRRRGGDVAAGDRDRAFLRRQFRAAHQPAAARGGRRSAAREPDRAGRRRGRICCSMRRRSGRRG